MITVDWNGGLARIGIGGPIVSLWQDEANNLARDLTGGSAPASNGYPIPSSANIGEYVISGIARSSDGTVVTIARVSDFERDTYGHGHQAYEAAGSVTLAPAERDALAWQLTDGGNR